MNNQLADPRLLSLSGKLKWAVGAVAVIGAGTLAWVYMVSLASIAVAGVMTMVVIQGAPWLSQKMANFFLDLRKADARANPITNRERIAGINRQKLEERRIAIETMDGEVKAWATQIANLPADEQADFAADLKASRGSVDRQALAWKEAEKQADLFDAVTAKVKRKWAVAQTGLRIKKLSQQDQEDRINVILSNEAADSADRALAMAFSNLDSIVETARANHPAYTGNANAITNNPSEAIDVPSRVITKETVNARS